MIQREARPRARGAAIVFVRRCSAVAESSTQVALLRHVDAGPDDGEVLVVVDAVRDAGQVDAGSGPAVRIRWIDVNHLEVAHDPRARTFRRAPVQRDLRITYVPLP